MGLGSKIKNALHGDHDNRASVSHRKAPGAYPSDEFLGKSYDGRKTPPGGSFVSDTKQTGTTAPTSGMSSHTRYSMSRVQTKILIIWI